MREMMASARLMVLVTHEIPTLEQMCNRAIWLQHGSVMMDGKPDEVVAAYKASVNTPQAAPHVGGLLRRRPGDDRRRGVQGRGLTAPDAAWTSRRSAS